jgi:hypothetical protein
MYPLPDWDKPLPFPNRRGDEWIERLWRKIDHVANDLLEKHGTPRELLLDVLSEIEDCLREPIDSESGLSESALYWRRIRAQAQADKEKGVKSGWEIWKELESDDKDS